MLKRFFDSIAPVPLLSGHSNSFHHGNMGAVTALICTLYNHDWQTLHRGEACMGAVRKKLFCPSGLTVAKDRENSRKWVAVRPPPKIDPLMDYRLCTSTRKKQPPCRNGPKCTFAHNTVELQEWNRKRGSFKKSHHDPDSQRDKTIFF